MSLFQDVFDGLPVDEWYGPHILQRRTLLEQHLRELIQDVGPPIDAFLFDALAAGQRLRPLLLLLVTSYGRNLRIPPTRLELDIAGAVEILHRASIVHDDFIDRSDHRRKAVTFQHRHSVGITIVTGDFMIAWAMRVVTKGFEREGHPHAAAVVGKMHEMAYQLARGELTGLTVAADAALLHPGLAQTLLQANEWKSASLIQGAAELGGLLAGRPDLTGALGEFGLALGNLFQLLDDLHDLEEDLRQNRLTPPLVRLLTQRRRVNPGDGALTPPTDPERNGLRDWAVPHVASLLGACRRALDGLAPDPVVDVLRSILELITDALGDAVRKKLPTRPDNITTPRSVGG